MTTSDPLLDAPDLAYDTVYYLQVEKNNLASKKLSFKS